MMVIMDMVLLTRLASFFANFRNTTLAVARMKVRRNNFLKLLWPMSLFANYLRLPCIIVLKYLNESKKQVLLAKSSLETIMETLGIN